MFIINNVCCDKCTQNKFIKKKNLVFFARVFWLHFCIMTKLLFRISRIFQDKKVLTLEVWLGTFWHLKIWISKKRLRISKKAYSRFVFKISKCNCPMHMSILGLWKSTASNLKVHACTKYWLLLLLFTCLNWAIINIWSDSPATVQLPSDFFRTSQMT